MHVNLRQLSLLLSILFWLPSLPAKADMIDKEGMKPYEVCALCHSLNGISVMAKFPKLAGQKASYIEKQFKDFLATKRTNDGGQMQAITTEVELKDLKGIALYFSQLPAPSAEPKPDMKENSEQYKLWMQGKDIFTKGLYSSDNGKQNTDKTTEKTHATGVEVACVSCHMGETSDKNNHQDKKMDYDAPHLQAQHQDYLMKQLEDFAKGDRINDPDKIMQKIASKLTETEIRAVALYLATTKRP